MKELLPLSIQLFADETEVEQVLETAVETKVDEAQGGVDPQEVENQGFSISEADYNKALQSAASKAKFELLKEIGYESVKDIKDLIVKGGQLDTLNVELDTIKDENNTLKQTLKETADTQLANAFDIPEKSRKLFIQLVDNIEDDIPREEKAAMIKEQLVGIVGLDVKVGVAKQNGKQKTEAELMREKQNL